MLLLSTAYLAPIQYYAHLYAAHETIEDRGEHYVKQTYRNRCYIATPTGAQPLTLPIVRDGAVHTAVRDIRLSDHGKWQHLHWTALTSAYESSPHFDFLVDFNDALRQTVLSLLSLDKNITPSNEYVTPTPEMTDLRSIISPKQSLEADTAFRPTPYYQVFKERTGFIPNLSIADLLFNMGPESRLVLKKSFFS